MILKNGTRIQGLLGSNLTETGKKTLPGRCRVATTEDPKTLGPATAAGQFLRPLPRRRRWHPRHGCRRRGCFLYVPRRDPARGRSANGWAKVVRRRPRRWNGNVFADGVAARSGAWRGGAEEDEDGCRDGRGRRLSS